MPTNRDVLMAKGYKRCTFHNPQKCALAYMNCCIALRDTKFGKKERSNKCPFYTTTSSYEIEEMIDEARKKYKELRSQDD